MTRAPHSEFTGPGGWFAAATATHGHAVCRHGGRTGADDGRDDGRIQRIADSSDVRQLPVRAVTISSCWRLAILLLHVIFVVSQRPHSLTSLAEALDLDKSTLSRTVESMVKAGLCERTTVAGDRRSVRLALSPLGRSKVDSINRMCDEYYGEVLGQLGDSVQRQVTRSVGILAESMKRLPHRKSRRVRASSLRSSPEATLDTNCESVGEAAIAAIGSCRSVQGRATQRGSGRQGVTQTGGAAGCYRQSVVTLAAAVMILTTPNWVWGSTQWPKRTVGGFDNERPSEVAASFGCSTTETPEDAHGQIHRFGCSRHQLHAHSGRTEWQKAQFSSSGDQWPVAYRSDKGDCSPATSVFRGRAPERLASRAAVAARRRVGSDAVNEESWTEERCARCSGVGASIATRKHRYDCVQGAEALHATSRIDQSALDDRARCDTHAVQNQSAVSRARDRDGWQECVQRHRAPSLGFQAARIDAISSRLSIHTTRSQSAAEKPTRSAASRAAN